MDFILCTARGAGIALANNITRYFHLMGGTVANSTEAPSQHRSRDTYTLNKLFVRVIANTITADSFVRTRKNTANGNQLVTIGADATGIFEDTSNTDSLATGDLANYSIFTGNNTTSITITLISTLLTHGAETSIVGSAGGISSAYNADSYSPLAGLPKPDTEVRNQITFRYTTVLSRLRTYWSTNGRTETTTIRSRKNGANGNQSHTVGATTTGEFEDTSNSDSLVSGDEFNSFNDITVGGGTAVIDQLNVESSAGGRLTGWLGVGSAFTADAYAPIHGGNTVTDSTITEANVKLKTRVAAAFKYLQCYVSSARNGNTIISFRVNGASIISLTCAASTTGNFEETSTEADTDADDDINLFIDISGTSGNFVAIWIGIHQIPLVTGITASATPIVVQAVMVVPTRLLTNVHTPLVVRNAITTPARLLEKLSTPTIVLLELPDQTFNLFTPPQLATPVVVQTPLTLATSALSRAMNPIVVQVAPTTPARLLAKQVTPIVVLLELPDANFALLVAPQFATPVVVNLNLTTPTKALARQATPVIAQAVLTIAQRLLGKTVTPVVVRLVLTTSTLGRLQTVTPVIANVLLTTATKALAKQAVPVIVQLQLTTGVRTLSKAATAILVHAVLTATAPALARSATPLIVRTALTTPVRSWRYAASPVEVEALIIPVAGSALVRIASPLVVAIELQQAIAAGGIIISTITGISRFDRTVYGVSAYNHEVSGVSRYDRSVSGVSIAKPDVDGASRFDKDVSGTVRILK